METILPPEVFYQLRKQSRRPETSLPAVILEDAIHAYGALLGARSRRGRHVFADVEEWFACDETRSPFAFVRVCEMLGLDPACIRFALQRWQAWRDDLHMAAVHVGRPEERLAS